jgi:hypothetical protein
VFKVEAGYFNETAVEKQGVIQARNPEDSLIHLICEFRGESHGKCIGASSGSKLSAYV